jgi:hypothetical protein
MIYLRTMMKFMKTGARGWILRRAEFGQIFIDALTRREPSRRFVVLFLGESDF